MDTSLLYTIFGSIFLIGYFFIVLEHKSHINKSGIAIIIGATLWLLASVFSHEKEEIGLAIAENGSEIFAVVVFLLSAMTIVEILVHYRFFDWIREQIVRREISQTKLFWLLGALTFVLSAFLDNLTTTLIMIQIGRKIYKHQENFLIFTANTIIAANAGGAASPIGDVTTIMLWLAGKFNALQIIAVGTIPAIVTWVIPQYLMGRKIVQHEEAEKAHSEFDIVDEEKVKPIWSVIIIGMCSFLLPVIFNLINLPPFLGLLLGVGILWTFIDLKSRGGHEHFATGKVVNIVQKTDIATLKFFIGILLAVGALSHIGLLKELNDFIFGLEINTQRLIIGNIILGLISAVLDNVPLVAAAIKMFADGIDPSLWVLLAITAGTGGSILLIGSAAGVAAMGQVKELNFMYYLKKASLPALLGYFGGVGMWLIMYLFR
ncbi:MAG: sodium:proton antiporter NhaD [Patescibacteria group bacterium]